MTVIPFYGADDPAMFAIERAAMDRAGRVVEELDARLPGVGVIADIGAGDGFTALRLESPQRKLIAVEPNTGMLRPDLPLHWVVGVAGALPFADASLDAAYATWAYFFSRRWDPTPGIGELHRTVRCGGQLLIVDNLGGDEFCGLAENDISADPEFWEERGFETTVIETAFEFATVEEARRLLGFFFGHRGRRGARLRIGYRVGLFARPSRGPS